MPNDLQLVTFPIARLALAYLLHSTLLLGGTWLVLRVARVRSWALEERLWKLAVILPLFTAAIPLPSSWSRPLARLGVGRVVPVSQKFEPHTAPVDMPRQPVIASGISPVDRTDWPVMDDAAVAARLSIAPTEERRIPAIPMIATVPTSETQTFETIPTADAPLLSPAAVAGICYTVVAFLFVGTLHVIRRSLVFRRSLADCREVKQEPICDVLADVLRRANVRRQVRLLVSTADRPPAAFGLLRWTIVLPHELIPALQPDELRALLGHEVAHLARGDAVWLWVGRIACSCFAFQPLNFLARARLRLAAEFLCDDWAVRNSANRFALARCLTRVAEWAGAARIPPEPLALAAVGASSSLAARVESLIERRRHDDAWNARGRRLLVGAAAIAVTCGLACGAPGNRLLADPVSRAPHVHSPDVGEGGQAEATASRAAALASLREETRELVTELRRVEALLKQVRRPDPAVQAAAARLQSRVVQLMQDQTRLSLRQASTPAGERSTVGK